MAIQAWQEVSQLSNIEAIRAWAWGCSAVFSLLEVFDV